METEILEPTGFPLDANDPLAPYHRLIHDYLKRIPAAGFTKAFTSVDRKAIHTFREKAASDILQLPIQDQFRCIRAYTRFLQWTRFERDRSNLKNEEIEVQSGYDGALNGLCSFICYSERNWNEEEVREFIYSDLPYWIKSNDLIYTIVDKHLSQHALTESFRKTVELVREWNSDLYRLDRWLRLGEVLGEKLVLHRGEKWADEAFAFIAQQPEELQEQWRDFLLHCVHSEEAKPSQKWLKTAAKFITAIGEETFRQRFVAWSADFGKTTPIYALNQHVFKGLVWSASLVFDPAIILALYAVALVAARPTEQADLGHGPFSPALFNACVWSLSQSDDFSVLVQLSSLKQKTRNKHLLNSLEKAFQTVAKRQNVTPEDLEEIAVPDFGLENGVIARDFGDVHVEIEVPSGKAIWNWTSEGKPLKAAPASVKRDFAAELKELKTAATELEKVFAAQKERLDGLLRAEKSWEFAIWKQRYLDHPLMALLARRVIWSFEENGEKIAALPTQNGFLDASGAALSVSGASKVKLWHPLFDSSENVLNWRRYFENSGQKQPFKQAHRELYRLTDAERQTRTYSNRFAAHILKQHQFNSLCAARGWKNSLRLMVDDDYPPATKIWPNDALRAEFWIEGIGEDYGTDTNETGTYLRVSTDQVRFYPLDAPQNSAHAGGGGYRVGYRAAPTEALALEAIPPLVFSETMRDCDLFVGVASLGADPAWRDGGPQGHFRDYWRDYSFGELGETAKSRADVLSRLLPRLKIRDAATLDGRFLRVQGRLRAYKIHLGSGNILMEPNDQYLCIVPARDENADVFLPFEGDKTLAVILSKAFLLADDDKIKDTGIMRQIKG